MYIVRNSTKFLEALDALRGRGGGRGEVGLINLAGRLHEGHGSLINAASTLCDIVVVAIVCDQAQVDSKIVSASEFKDIAFCEQRKVSILYFPDPSELSPPQNTHTLVEQQQPAFRLPQIETQRLTNHLKLLYIVAPDILFFGEKQFFEFHSVRALIKDLHIKTRIARLPTVRHPDGTVVCRSIARMNALEREQAPILWETLKNVAHAIRCGAREFEKLEITANMALRQAGCSVIYFKVLDEGTLNAANTETVTYRIAGRVKLGACFVTDSLGLTL